MDIPQDFNDPFYGHLKNDILGMLTGPLASQNESEESAIRKIRQHCGAEKGYSDALVTSMPEWKAKFGIEDEEDFGTEEELETSLAEQDVTPTEEELAASSKNPEAGDTKEGEQKAKK